MKIFLSWSQNLSKKLAEEFKNWLPSVIQAVKPYFSPEDIAKGTRWNSEISKELELSKIGILFITRENYNAPWIMFEAGSLAKSIDNSRVCPILFGLSPTDIDGPLTQFQAAEFSKDEIKRVILMINQQLDGFALDGKVLADVFEMWWPRLKEKVEEILKSDPVSSSKANIRKDREILEEILLLLRNPRRPLTDISPMAITDLVEGYYNIVSTCIKENIAKDSYEALIHMKKPISYMAKRIIDGKNKSEIADKLSQIDEVLQIIHNDYSSRETKEDIGES